MTLADHLNNASAQPELKDNRLYLTDLIGAELIQVGPYRLTETQTTDLVTSQLVTHATTPAHYGEGKDQHTAHYSNERWHTPA